MGDEVCGEGYAPLPEQLDGWQIRAQDTAVWLHLTEDFIQICVRKKIMFLVSLRWLLP